MVQMLQIGEETGEMGSILERLAKFYQREVNSAVDTLVALIEPVLIILLGRRRGLPLGVCPPAYIQHDRQSLDFCYPQRLLLAGSQYEAILKAPANLIKTADY